MLHSNSESYAPASNSIVIWNRQTKSDETEKVYGEALIQWLYGSRVGQKISESFVSDKLLSRLYGYYQSSSLSQRKIEAFIQDFSIPMDEYEKTSYASFNDFFIRKFRPGARVFEKTPEFMPAFAEARYFGFEKIEPDLTFPVKGQYLTPLALLERKELAKDFMGGSLLIARLCPTDYHRFHYPDSGHTMTHYRVPGKLHSVNPAALKFKGEIFSTNERHVSILKTDHFGKIAYVEVGAMCVGKIVQTFRAESPFNRGDEKGYFLFGASTVIVLGEPGAWKIDSDILEMTAQRKETLVRLGQRVAAS